MASRTSEGTLLSIVDKLNLLLALVWLNKRMENRSQRHWWLFDEGWVVAYSWGRNSKVSRVAVAVVYCLINWLRVRNRSLHLLINRKGLEANCIYIFDAYIWGWDLKSSKLIRGRGTCFGLILFYSLGIWGWLGRGCWDFMNCYCCEENWSCCRGICC